MDHQDPPTERQRASELAREFVESDLLSESVEDDVVEHLDRGKSIRALRTIIRHRRDHLRSDE
jgi:hypothetical protein